MNFKKFKILWIVLSCIALERFCYVQTSGFRLSKIHSDFVYGATHTETETPEILNQPFTFLGSGVQCYAFLSEDGTTVLKLFKHYHNMPIQGWMKEMPLPAFLNTWRSHILAKREARLRSIFSSCELAWKERREETGLLFLHLGSTTHLQKRLTLRDKLGISHQIDLDEVAFVLQKKAETLPSHMKRLEREKISLTPSLNSLAALIQSRWQKGIANTDLRLDRNIGFIENRAIEIDVGSFQRMNEKTKEIEKSILNTYLHAHTD